MKRRDLVILAVALSCWLPMSPVFGQTRKVPLNSEQLHFRGCNYVERDLAETTPSRFPKEFLRRSLSRL